MPKMIKIISEAAFEEYPKKKDISSEFNWTETVGEMKNCNQCFLKLLAQSKILKRLLWVGESVKFRVSVNNSELNLTEYPLGMR